MYKEIEIELDDFDDDEIFEFVEASCKCRQGFREEVIKIARKFSDDKEELIDILVDLPKYPNQQFAKEQFEAMEFSKDLVAWVLKTYGNQSNRGCKNDLCKS